MLVKSKACLKYISVPPRKMRLVGDMVKGMPVEKALNILNFTPRIAAHHIAKTLKSAASNALSLEGTDHLKPEDLLVKNIIVDAAPTAKRIRFQSMGRAFRYRKRFCHLTILIEGQMDVTVESKPVKAKKTAKDTADTKEKKTAVKKKKVLKKTAKKKNTFEKKAVVKSAVTKKKTVARKKTD
ncbi:MAG: 50S ribosomal protein L22 [Candidatus Zixiibacteriota bacterium]|nr:MAG: 50S ribosomal protein L22 [candidate division Zixibacteria bacterium]